MINILLAYDDNDSELADYFSESFKDVSTELIKNPLVNLTSMCGLECTESIINQNIQNYSGNSFAFVGLTHGNPEQLLTENEVFISSTNSHLFNSSFFYSTACSVGHSLGNELVQKGCATFIGYNKPIDVWEGYYDVFITCENIGLKEFVVSDKTAKESYLQIISTYNDAIDELMTGGVEDKIVASILAANKDSLVIIGNIDLVFNDLSN